MRVDGRKERGNGKAEETERERQKRAGGEGGKNRMVALEEEWKEAKKMKVWVKERIENGN